MGHLSRVVRGADIVHVLGFRDPIGTVACIAAARAGVPFVMEPVGMHRRRLRSVRLKRAFDAVLGSWLLERAAITIATSSLEANELVADGHDPGTIVVRPNGVDVDDLVPSPERGAFRSAHGVPADVPLVLSLGRIARKKGLTTLVEALAELPGVWGAIVGPDDGDGALGDVRAAIERLGSTSVVVVPHGLWGRDKRSVFADADAFCLPSATENFGNAPAEAAALGIPAVVSDRCGVAELLPLEAHTVVPFGDVVALRAAIETALKPDRRKAAKRAAPAIRERLSWGSVATEQAAIYERVLR
jgi:glycosyltransferase involved in cell wall biosynthesis